MRNFELLVVDDASTDGSPGIIERYARLERRIRTFRLARNGGTAHARNVALEHAQAPFVAICDDDDRQLPQWLAAQVAYLEAHPRHVMCTTGVVARNASTIPILHKGAAT